MLRSFPLSTLTEPPLERQGPIPGDSSNILAANSPLPPRSSGG